MVGYADGDEVSLPCRAAGWMKEEREGSGVTPDRPSACWSCNFIHAPSAGMQAVAQVGRDLGFPALANSQEFGLARSCL